MTCMGARRETDPIILTVTDSSTPAWFSDKQGGSNFAGTEVFSAGRLDWLPHSILAPGPSRTPRHPSISWVMTWTPQSALEPPADTPCRSCPRELWPLGDPGSPVRVSSSGVFPQLGTGPCPPVPSAALPLSTDAQEDPVSRQHPSPRVSPAPTASLNKCPWPSSVTELPSLACTPGSRTIRLCSPHEVSAPQSVPSCTQNPCSDGAPSRTVAPTNAGTLSEGDGARSPGAPCPRTRHSPPTAVPTFSSNTCEGPPHSPGLPPPAVESLKNYMIGSLSQ